MDPMYSKVMNLKTPASWIQEIAAKQGVVPKFDYEDVARLTNSPVPMFKCTLFFKYNNQELYAEATERTKKDAKHRVSLVMLDSQMKLTPKDYFELNGGEKKSHSKPAASHSVCELMDVGRVSEASEDIGLNPIGELGELCVKMGLNVPEYHEEPMVGPPHKPTFEVKCQVQDLETTAKENSKKEAKRKAAHKMVQYLRSLSIEQIKTRVHLNGSIDSLSVEEKLNELKISEYKGAVFRKPCTSQFGDCVSKVSHLNHGFQRMTGDLINALNDLDVAWKDNLESHGGAIKFLMAIAQEQSFTLSYIDIPLLSTTKEAQVLVQLDLSPTCILCASGPDANTARTLAAYDTLLYLQLMTRK